MPRRFGCLIGPIAAVLLLVWVPSGVAAAPRIIKGSPASQGEYPAHGSLRLSTNRGVYSCGGTLVSNRFFLTAAHCATQPDSTTSLVPSALTVSLGKVRQSAFTAPDRYSVLQNRVHEGYALIGPDEDIPTNDVALLTLGTSAPTSLEPLRLVEAGETGLWADGDDATVIGWGGDETGDFPDVLQEAIVPMRADAYCEDPDVWGTTFLPPTMVCAGGGETDTCSGDSGGPLMVSDGAFLVLAGLTSWGENVCATPDVPGVYTRIGDPELNTWVRDHVPMARASVADAKVDPGESVTFSVTANHPGIADDFTDFAWDFDSDGNTDANGSEMSVTHAYPAEGRFVARVRATGSGSDTATDKVAIQVGDPPPTREPTPEPTPAPTVEPTTAPAPGSNPAPTVIPPAAVAVDRPTPGVSLATILTTRRPRIRRGRLAIRVRFARGAPAGTAVVELVQSGRRIGIARTRVLRGGTRRLRVKLMPRGRRLLAGSVSRRLTLKVRVRVGRRVLRSKTVTIRR